MDIWYIFRTFGISYGTLVYFVVIWYIFIVLVNCTAKNLAILVHTGVPKTTSKEYLEPKLLLSANKVCTVPPKVLTCDVYS
jgi:hypothetical protein